MEYTVLFTHQKTKKAKTWQDGVLSVVENKAILYDEKKTKLDCMFINATAVIKGEQLESDRYLILIEDEQPSVQFVREPAQSVSCPVSEPAQSVSCSVREPAQSVSRSVRVPVRAGLKRKNNGFVPPRFIKQADCQQEHRLAADADSSKATCIEALRNIRSNHSVSDIKQSTLCDSNILNLYTSSHGKQQLFDRKSSPVVQSYSNLTSTAQSSVKSPQGNIQQGNTQQGNIQQGNIQQGNIQQGNIQQGNMQQGNIQQGNKGNIQQGNIQQGNIQQGNIQQGLQTLSGNNFSKQGKDKPFSPWSSYGAKSVPKPSFDGVQSPPDKRSVQLSREHVTSSEERSGQLSNKQVVLSEEMYGEHSNKLVASLEEMNGQLSKVAASEEMNGQLSNEHVAPSETRNSNLSNKRVGSPDHYNGHQQMTQCDVALSRHSKNVYTETTLSAVIEKIDNPTEGSTGSKELCDSAKRSMSQIMALLGKQKTGFSDQSNISSCCNSLNDSCQNIQLSMNFKCDQSIVSVSNEQNDCVRQVITSNSVENSVLVNNTETKSVDTIPEKLNIRKHSQINPTNLEVEIPIINTGSIYPQISNQNNLEVCCNKDIYVTNDFNFEEVVFGYVKDDCFTEHLRKESQLHLDSLLMQTNLNVSGMNEMEVTQITQCELSGVNEREVTQITQWELSGVNEREVTQITQCELSGVNEREVTQITQCELSGVNEREVTQITQCEPTNASYSTSLESCDDHTEDLGVSFDINFSPLSCVSDSDSLVMDSDEKKLKSLDSDGGNTWDSLHSTKEHSKVNNTTDTVLTSVVTNMACSSANDINENDMLKELNNYQSNVNSQCDKVFSQSTDIETKSTCNDQQSKNCTLKSSTNCSPSGNQKCLDDLNFSPDSFDLSGKSRSQHTQEKNYFSVGDYSKSEIRSEDISSSKGSENESTVLFHNPVSDYTADSLDEENDDLLMGNALEKRQTDFLIQHKLSSATHSQPYIYEASQCSSSTSNSPTLNTIGHEKPLDDITCGHEKPLDDITSCVSDKTMENDTEYCITDNISQISYSERNSNTLTTDKISQNKRSLLFYIENTEFDSQMNQKSEDSLIQNDGDFQYMEETSNAVNRRHTESCLSGYEEHSDLIENQLNHLALPHPEDVFANKRTILIRQQKTPCKTLTESDKDLQEQRLQLGNLRDTASEKLESYIMTGSVVGAAARREESIHHDSEPYVEEESFYIEITDKPCLRKGNLQVTTSKFYSSPAQFVPNTPNLWKSLKTDVSSQSSGCWSSQEQTVSTKSYVSSPYNSETLQFLKSPCTEYQKSACTGTLHHKLKSPCTGTLHHKLKTPLISAPDDDTSVFIASCDRNGLKETDFVQGCKTDEGKGKTTDDRAKGKTTEDDRVKGKTTEDDRVKGKTTEDDRVKGKTTEDDRVKGKTTEDDRTKGKTTEDDRGKGEIKEDQSLTEMSYWEQKLLQREKFGNIFIKSDIECLEDNCKNPIIYLGRFRHTGHELPQLNNRLMDSKLIVNSNTNIGNRFMESIHKGDNCDRLMDSIYMGDNCDRLMESIHKGDNCDRLMESIHKGDNCDRSRLFKHCCVTSVTDNSGNPGIDLKEINRTSISKWGKYESDLQDEDDDFLVFDSSFSVPPLTDRMEKTSDIKITLRPPMSHDDYFDENVEHNRIILRPPTSHDDTIDETEKNKRNKDSMFYEKFDEQDRRFGKPPEKEHQPDTRYCKQPGSEEWDTVSVNNHENVPYKINKNQADMTWPVSSDTCNMTRPVSTDTHLTSYSGDNSGLNRTFRSPVYKMTETVKEKKMLQTPCVGSRRDFICPTPVLTSCILKGTNRNLGSDLQFPSLQEITENSQPSREIQIPTRFTSLSMYKQVFTAALKEHLNIILFDLGVRYHHALSKIDTTSYLPSVPGKENTGPVNSNPVCKCGAPSKMIQVKKSGPNHNRFFYTCNAARNIQCKFFQWSDDTRGHHNKNGTDKLLLSDPTSIMSYIRSHHIYFYCDCVFVKKSTENIMNHFKRNIPNWVKQKMGIDATVKKRMYIQLSKKDNSSLFSKDDLWIVSKHLDFRPSSTILCKSTYYGPTAGNEIEIEPIASFSPSNWSNQEKCHAILAGNVSGELSYLSNIEDNLSLTDVPILQFVLNNNTEGNKLGFNIPVRMTENIYVPESYVDNQVEEMINQYRLNEDQSTALLRVARLFTHRSQNNVLLIHGVFGAGKSFLLSVVVLFLVWLFEKNDSYTPRVPFPWKLVIASTTNVAVDRILNGLLALGFEDFVRVGSVKKISKPVLPYSVHATGSDSQELKDLQMMLRSDDLTAAEKQNVRQSIEKHKLGENRKRLSNVRVVGVTCASCSSPSLKDMQFPIVLLDECSQMTEPASMLPVAKFRCQKLVLVGDPKQLDPTIQGSESSTEYGLEQTLFDRLILMGHSPVILHTQYRCHPDISGVSNSLFYNKQLQDGVSQSDRQPLMENLPALCFYDVADGLEHSDSDGSFYNEKEAEFIVFLIDVLICHDVDADRIGVISLYKSQMYKVMALLGTNKNCKEFRAVMVSTVDAFQGGERDVIILSCVRTKNVGFIDNEKRTNVALTRAKHHLLIVGNENNLRKNKLWSQIIQHCMDTSPDGLQKASLVREKFKLEELRATDSSLIKQKKRKSRQTKRFSQISDNASSPMSLSDSSKSQLLSSGDVVKGDCHDFIDLDREQLNMEENDPTSFQMLSNTRHRKKRRRIDASLLDFEETVCDSSDDEDLPSIFIS